MSVILDKATHSFTVLIGDGAVHGVTLTPDSTAAREHLHHEAYWVHCLNVQEVTAVDAYEASIKALMNLNRERAIEDYMLVTGERYEDAARVYRDLLTSARRLTPDERAEQYELPVCGAYSALRHEAATEARVERGELAYR
ncbi:hypothetical protein QR97_01770 [Streptomyces sp. PBH53]|uniref:hypothetical protein n=1 Tax=Streptomyces sp. PBH53 TaxID=1577075 RepID=UPI000655F36C|nr:hypothetical protein [Streptomyces sp. PBH53]AKN68700.1 hypothetical protein QR97_01770 [Streptomyces sp. PBH53]